MSWAVGKGCPGPYHIRFPDSHRVGPRLTSPHHSSHHVGTSSLFQTGPIVRFVQLTTFYNQYLRAFYMARPGLAQASHAEQMTTLLADGFSSLHLVGLDMAPYGYDPVFIVANALSIQHAWARERGLVVADGEAGLPTILQAQMDHYRPEILYLQDPVSFDARFIAALPTKPRLVLGWRAASIGSTTDWRGIDVLLSSDAGCRAEGVARGARRSEPFLPGIPADFDRHLPPVPTAPLADIVFCGQISHDHGSRVQMLERVAHAARERGWSLHFHVAVSPGLHLPPALTSVISPPLFGNAMYQALRDARICLNNHIDILGGRGQNMRVFEATGSGAFLLTEDDPNLTSLFDAGQEVATFGSDAALLERIGWYLDHPQERDEIARRGRARCWRDHTRPQRAEWLHRIIQAG